MPHSQEHSRSCSDSSQMASGNTCLCHGAAGIADVLLMARDDSELSRHICSRLRISPVMHPGLLTGLAGIGTLTPPIGECRDWLAALYSSRRRSTRMVRIRTVHSANIEEVLCG